MPSGTAIVTNNKSADRVSSVEAGSRVTNSAAQLPSGAGRSSIPAVNQARSGFGQLPVIELAVKPVAISGHVFLHRHIEPRLIQRDARHVGEGKGDKALDLLLVFLGIGLETSGVNELVHCWILVTHLVERGVLPMVVPVKEVIGIVEPSAEYVVKEG